MLSADQIHLEIQASAVRLIGGVRHLTLPSSFLLKKGVYLSIYGICIPTRSGMDGSPPGLSCATHFNWMEITKRCTVYLKSGPKVEGDGIVN